MNLHKHARLTPHGRVAFPSIETVLKENFWQSMTMTEGAFWFDWFLRVLLMLMLQYGHESVCYQIYNDLPPSTAMIWPLT